MPSDGRGAGAAPPLPMAVSHLDHLERLLVALVGPHSAYVPLSWLLARVFRIKSSPLTGIKHWVYTLPNRWLGYLHFECVLVDLFGDFKGSCKVWHER